MSNAAKILREAYGLTVSDAGARCADLVETWVGGLHHYPEGQRALRKTDWSGDHVTFLMYGSVATFDFDQLTRLVFLAHDHAIRVEVQPAMRYLRILLHPRVREGTWDTRHPTLEATVAKWREHHPNDKETT